MVPRGTLAAYNHGKAVVEKPLAYNCSQQLPPNHEKVSPPRERECHLTS